MSNAHAEKSTHAAPAPTGGGGDDLASQVEAMLSQVESLTQELAVPDETPAPIDKAIEAPAEVPIENEVEPANTQEPEALATPVAITPLEQSAAADSETVSSPEEPSESPAPASVEAAAPVAEPVAADLDGSTVADAPAPDNIDDLDAQLANLTDSLIQETKQDVDIADEPMEDIETAANVASEEAAPVPPQPPAPSAAPQPQAPVAKPEPVMETPPKTAPKVPAPAQESVASAPTVPSIPARIGSKGSRFFQTTVASIQRIALTTLSMPLRSQSVAVRDTLGWVALATLFWAGCLWAYMLLFYKPPTPAPPANATGLVAAAGDGHGSGEHGGGGHGGDGHEPAPHGATAAHSPAKPSASHTAKPAKKEEGHAAKPASSEGGGHGAAAGPKKIDKPILDQFTVIPPPGAKPAKKEEGHGGGH